MKFICIKSSKWYHIDDSVEQNLNGGPFEFVEGEKYDCTFFRNVFGDSYSVKFDEYRIVGFGLDTDKGGTFLKHFKLYEEEK